jgi:hypothetical protein
MIWCLDELPKFEETWRGNARERLPEWNPDMIHGGIGSKFPIFFALYYCLHRICSCL